MSVFLFILFVILMIGIGQKYREGYIPEAERRWPQDYL